MDNDDLKDIAATGYLIYALGEEGTGIALLIVIAIIIVIALFVKFGWIALIVIGILGVTLAFFINRLLKKADKYFDFSDDEKK